MTQTTTHSCANCGSSVPDTMRFCPNCGIAAGIPQAPPPPANSYAPTQNAASFTAYPQQNNQPPLQGNQPPPAYARPQKNSSRGVLRVAVILLLLLVLLGAGGYFALHAL